MRFILGLIIGATLTFGVASVMNGPTRVNEDGRDGFDIAADIASNIAAKFASHTAAKLAAKVETSQARRDAGADSALSSDPDTQGSTAPYTLKAPNTLTALETNRDNPALDRIAETVEAVAISPGSDPALAAMNGNAQPVPRATSDGIRAEVKQAPVWIPFHSEKSASGFAERLALEVGHGFDVNKQGPRRYQVVFAYADDVERDAVLGRVEMLTGYRAQ